MLLHHQDNAECFAVSGVEVKGVYSYAKERSQIPWSKGGCEKEGQLDHGFWFGGMSSM